MHLIGTTVWSFGLVMLVITSAVAKSTVPDDGTFRLVGGTKPSEGRVEVFYKDGWGTVCDDFWGMNEADMVCRSVGYSAATHAYQGPSKAFSGKPKHNFGAGSGNILLDDMNCYDNAMSLSDCTYRDWGFNECVHEEDAGVSCV